MSAAFDYGDPFRIPNGSRIPLSDSRVRHERLELAFSAAEVAELATRAAIFEVAATPKPGLVCIDRNGAHTDMDYALFVRSAFTLKNYFMGAHALGEETHAMRAGAVFPRLRALGAAAEQRMFAATGGVNTHKGLIFSMGLFCAAIGRLNGTAPAVGHVCRTAASFAGGLVRADFAALPCGALPEKGIIPAPATPKMARPHLETAIGRRLTAGEAIYLLYGITGIRGEAERGFPHVALAWNALWRHGVDASMNTALVHCLLELIRGMDDTNILWRGGIEGLEFAREQADGALTRDGLRTTAGREWLQGMCTAFERRRLSPGGCADILAVAVFLHLLRRHAEGRP